MVPPSQSVVTPLLQPYALTRDAERPEWLEDALGLINGGEKEGVDQIIEMLGELHQDGRDCRYVKKFKGLPLFELKPKARGGHRGGARWW